jgi:hypothetical protein
MAFRKAFTTDPKKMYYAKIHMVNYRAILPGQSIRDCHVIGISLITQDIETGYVHKIQPLTFEIPVGKKRKDGAGQSSIDESYKNIFNVKDMTKGGENILSISYRWLKENEELFVDFEDVFEEGQAPTKLLDK